MDYDEPGEDHYNDPGTITSPQITSTDPSGWCVTFWYHMYGDYINTLRAYSSQRGFESDSLWTRKGVQGTVWRYGQVRNGILNEQRKKQE